MSEKKMDEKNPGNKKPDTTLPTRKPLAEMQLGRDDLVIFGENGKFYVVSPETYKSEPLPSKLMSTSEFLVGLGSMVSDISAFQSFDRADQPDELQPLTKNMKGIVLNLAAIRQVSEKAGDRPISMLAEPDCKCQETPAVKPAQPVPPDPQIQKEELRLEKDDLVIFGTDRTFYLLKKRIYEKVKLPRELESTPMLMVQLGAQLADMPSLPTAGSACYLLNLASLRHGSAKAAVLITKNSLEAELGDERYHAARLDAELEELEENKKVPIPRMASFKPPTIHAHEDETDEQMVKRLAKELRDLKKANTEKQKAVTRLKKAKKGSPKLSAEELARKAEHLEKRWQELETRRQELEKWRQELEKLGGRPLSAEGKPGDAEAPH